MPESPGRQPINNPTPIPRYHHQMSQPLHQLQQSSTSHSQSARDTCNRSPDIKNSISTCSSSVNQPQNIPAYPSTNVHQQHRSFPPNAVAIPNHSQNVSTQSSKSQRTSPISASAVPNGNTDYPSKQSSIASQPVPHQYHVQNQPYQSNVVSSNNQRKHHHQQQHHHLVGKGDFSKPVDYFCCLCLCGVWHPQRIVRMVLRFWCFFSSPL